MAGRMTEPNPAAGSGRTDSAERSINADQKNIYSAFVSSEALASWLPPAGMSGEVENFVPEAGGGYRLTLRYDDLPAGQTGKSSADTDVIDNRFIELDPCRRIVQTSEFVTTDPAFTGRMRTTWSFATDGPGVTRVRIVVENVPAGIRQAEHEEGLKATLDNLARFVSKD